MRKRLFAAAVLAVLCFVIVSSAYAASRPSEVIIQASSSAKAVLDNTRLSPKEKRERLKKIILPIFDVEEMAKRTLATHWQPNREQMPEFIPLFVGLLEKNYLNLNKLEDARGIETVVVSERIGDGNAEVHTVVNMRGKNIRVSYRLKKTGERWMIYDLVVEGVSLVSSYRSQFNKIILTSSFEELMSRMREKVAEPEDRR